MLIYSYKEEISEKRMHGTLRVRTDLRAGIANPKRKSCYTIPVDDTYNWYCCEMSNGIYCDKIYL